MALKPRIPESDGPYELTPKGSFPARLYRLVDLGTHEYRYQDQVGHAPMIQYSFELPTKKMADGRPFSITATSKYLYGKKANWRKLLAGWLGDDFDLANFDPSTLVGRPALITVLHNVDSAGKTWANLGIVSPLPEGFECPPQVNESLVFDLANFRQKDWDRLGTKTQNKIELSPEYQQLFAGTKTAWDDDPYDGFPSSGGLTSYPTDIPF
jgi:hypothetical protein